MFPLALPATTILIVVSTTNFVTIKIVITVRKAVIATRTHVKAINVRKFPALLVQLVLIQIFVEILYVINVDKIATVLQTITVKVVIVCPQLAVQIQLAR